MAEIAPHSIDQMSSSADMWRFHNPVEVNFGDNVRSQIGQAVSSDDCFALVCTQNGRQRIEADAAFSDLIAREKIVWLSDVEANPDIDNVQGQVDKMHDEGVKIVIAIGGGSVMDTAKALAAGLGCKEHETLRQMIASPEKVKSIKPLHLIAVPTTAGTGSEVTPFATLWDRKLKKKMSLSGPNLFPKQAFLDPHLTLSASEDVTVSTGLDAVNQAFESIWNRQASPVSLQFAMRAVALGMMALPALVEKPKDMLARRQMMESSLLAGLAISQTRTALCHSISYPLTSYFEVPHGLACAFTMRAVFGLNASFDGDRLRRLAEFMQLDGVDALEKKLADMLQGLGVGHRVRALVPSLEEIQNLAGEMFTPGRADNCVFPVTNETILSVLEISYRQP